MPREARKISESGFYHIVYRGINHQNIFEEEQDFEYTLEILKVLKEEIKFEMHAYCLMTNHVDILLKENHPGDKLKRLTGIAKGIMAKS